ncbi:MAG: hypothetical protein JNK82_28985 [Myxococcaceae bacterium]|nr:hypothetical protein [Myxococcaceae bacterium]
MPSFVVAASLAALICAQAGAGAPAPGRMPKLAPPRLWRPPAVKLVSAGEAPLAPLRYALVKGAQGALDLAATGRWRVKTSNSEANTELPNLSTPFSYAVVSPGQFSFEFQEATSKGAGSENDNATQGIISALKGVRGSVELDARGLAQKLSIMPSPLDAEFSQDSTRVTVGSHYALELARSAFMHVLTPLPDEPIGIGGSWQVERPQTRGTVSFTEVATYTLVSRDAKGAKLTVRFGGKPDPLAGIHPNQMELTVSGSGETDLEFARPFPVRIDDQLLIHALTGPKETHQRVEHEGTVTGHLQLSTRKLP